MAYVPVALFTEYKYLPWSEDNEQASWPEGDNAPETCVEINLDTFLTCLEIFSSGKTSSLSLSGQDRFRRGGGAAEDSFDNSFYNSAAQKSTALRLEYQAPGEPLLLLYAGVQILMSPRADQINRLSEGGVVTRCELVTYEPDDILDLGFEEDANIARIIMKSEALKEAFSALGADSGSGGSASCDTITFEFKPAQDESEYAHMMKKQRITFYASTDQWNSERLQVAKPPTRLDLLWSLADTRAHRM